jgi:DHA3 family macrolide efflux protein-like MFS transporter
MAFRTTISSMRVFLLIWFGQVISLIGSELTGFGLGVWVYQRTGSATQFALIAVATTLPGIVLSPLAGAVVDRLDRRLVLLLSDTGAALSTLSIALLIMTGQLETWHIYVLMGISSAFSAFHWPAFAASISLLVPKQHYGRAGGMVEFGQAAAQTVSPVIAGLLIVVVQLGGVVLIDVITFLFAVTTLLLVRIPMPKKSAEDAVEAGSFWRDVGYGWKYVTARRGLFTLLLFFASINFSAAAIGVLIPPLVLSFTTVEVLGTVLSVAFAGMVLGSITMSVWGGPKPGRRMGVVIALAFVQGVLIIIDGLQPSALLITAVGFVYLFVSPIITGSDQAIWLSKTPPSLQGRVFATQRMMSWSTVPLAFLVAGPLADYVFGPLLVEGGPLAGSVGQIIGVGPGRGIGLLFIVMGTLMVLVTILASLYPRLTRLEAELPDAIPDTEEAPPVEEESAMGAEGSVTAAASRGT